MSKEVQVINPAKHIEFLENGDPIMSGIKRVGAYCRVSTDSEEQKTSYDAQVDEWTRRITENPKFKLVKIYADEGISGTSIKNRNGFNEMMADARNHKLDLIFTKSVSRFARNTLLTISSLKELKELGVEVRFDNENMSSFDSNSECMFTIMSSLAQEESRHISDNVKWSLHKKMREGHPFVNCTRFLGYNKDPETGNLVVNQEEAVIVKMIFDMYTSGIGPAEISRALEAKGYKTGAGSTHWRQSTISSILKNEKYKGDLLLQKTVTVDYLTHRKKKNNGITQKYFVKNNHEAIVSEEQWDIAQSIIARRRNAFEGENKDRTKYNTRYPLSGRMICYKCGNTYKRRHWCQRVKPASVKIMYQCDSFIQNGIKDCQNEPVNEELILTCAADVINSVFLKGSDVFKRIMSELTSVLKVEDIQSKLEAKTKELESLDDEISKLLEMKLKTTDDDEILFLERKYREAINKVKSLNIEIKTLESDSIKNEDLRIRMDKIKEFVMKDELTFEELTKDIIDPLIYKIIIVDRNHYVFVVDATKGMDPKEVVFKRTSIVNLPSVYEGKKVVVQGRKKYQGSYKVVIV